MKFEQSTVQRAQLHLLQDCPLPATAPFEIHGARDRGCLPGSDYLYQGYRYVQDVVRDVLIREDVYTWLATRQYASL
ncbi:MAG: hypothetical protein ACXWJK_00735 [Burkholderiaceae bacterium]